MPADRPVTVDLPWWPKPSGATSRREPLTRDQIVAGALRLIDEQGLEALSMRRLGQLLGAGATSAYTYVQNKDELIALVGDHIVGEILQELSLDASPTWKDQAAEFSRTVRRVLTRNHPNAAPLFVRPSAGPNALTVVEELLGILRPAGFEGKTLILAYSVILNHGYSYAAAEAATLPSTPEAAREQMKAMAESLATSLPAEHFPNLVAAAPAIADMTTDDQFEFGLQRLLDGLQVLLERGHRQGS